MQGKDDILLHRGRPGECEIDRNGFRNPEVPEKIDVVFTGDFHTYGSGVPVKKPFPYVYSQLSGMKVYQMAMGGYGMLQYFYLYRNVRKFNPKYAVLASMTEMMLWMLIGR